MSAVLDASALLAYLQREPGAGSVKAVLGSAIMSTVNWTEVIQKAADSEGEAAELRVGLESLGLILEPFSASQAGIAGSLRDSTMELGLSLGDRACLALAIEKGETILTADRIWRRLRLGIGIGIEVIR